MNSYEKINYKLRPQKRIERALIAELINNFEHIIGEKVNYIGMGSLFYTDFVYFNKYCNLNKMISIEMMDDENGEYDSQKETRFRNNKPLDSIMLIPKKTSEAIEELPFDESNFIWFDYDGCFEPSIISDVENIIEKTSQSSIIAISYNDFIPKQYKSKRELNIDKCKREFNEYILDGVDDNFTVDDYSKIAAGICESYLKEKVGDYNKINGADFALKRLSKVEYQDGAKMNTLIWVLLDKSKPYAESFDEKIWESEICGELNLKMEILTLFEKQLLDRKSIEDKEQTAEEMGLDLETVEQYYKYAKYIPEYTEVVV
ncbi:MAG: hypothetical protein NC489_20655 [Ruminococcus flavefaciens]|nr:hypothetical protein [Ruminococcus flavefaciens]